MTPARKDGRPQYYDIGSEDFVQCYHCLRNKNSAHYSQREGFIADPANSPAEDGGVYTVCLSHLPDNAVIHDPYANLTRTKDGANTWRE